MKHSPPNINESALSEGGNSCSLKGAVMFAFGIKGALPLLHAGPGCSFTAYYGQILHSGEVYPFANSAICSKEVIFGGEKALKNAIESAGEVHRPDIIVTIPGCQPLTIGDDVQEVVRSLEKSMQPVELVNAGSGGYEGNLYDGFVKAGLAFLEKFCQTAPVRSKRVNIIGLPAHINVYWKGDIIEIRDLLSSLGLEIGCFFPGDADLASIRQIPSAELNLVVDEQTGVEMARYLESRFGTPYIIPEYGSLIGTDNTLAFLFEIIERLGLNRGLQNVVKEKRNRALQMASQGYPLWCELIQHAFNTFAVSAPASMAIGLSRLLMTELGMEPKLINLNATFAGARDKLVELMETHGNGFDPLILENADDYHINESFGDNWPSIILGKGTTLKSDAFLNDTRAYMSVAYPALDRLITYTRPVMGFSGVPALLDDILNRVGYFF